MSASSHPLLFTATLIAAMGAPGILVAILCALQRRCGMHPELSRKAAHIGTGMLCLSFPWLFEEVWPVLAWSAATTLALMAIRWVPLCQRLMGDALCVDRISLGEMYFPVAIGTMFWLAHGDWLLYLIPVLVLTVADAVGALVGVRYGLHRYKTQEGEKSMEGSVAFFSAAFLSTHVPLLLFSNIGRAECLLIGITIGLIIMLVEAISWRGLDNLFIPIGTFYLLRSYWPLDKWDLLLRLFILVALALLSVVCRNRTTLSDNALMAASLSAFGLWALGGWPYLISPLLLFLLHVFLPSFHPGPRPMLSLYAVTRVITGAYLYLFVALNFGTDIGWIPFHICLACSTANMVSARLSVVCENMSFGRHLWMSWASAVVLFSPTIICIVPSDNWLMAMILLAIAVLVSVLVFSRYWSPVTPEPGQQPRQWFVESAVAPLAACVGWLSAVPL